MIFDLLHKIIACRFSNILDWLCFDIKQIPNAFVIIGAATKIMRNFALPHFHAKLEKLKNGSLKLISDNKTLRRTKETKVVRKNFRF